MTEDLDISTKLNKLVRQYKAAESDQNLPPHIRDDFLSATREAIFALGDKAQLEETRAIDKQEIAGLKLDPLTGLHNRGAYNLKIKELVDAGKPFSLLFLDIDHFGAFNKTHGHAFGDLVLASTAAKIKDVRGGYAARYGGEELVVLIEDIDPMIAELVAGRIRHRIEANEIIEHRASEIKNNQPLRAKVTASIGVSEFVPGETAASVFRRANKACLEAKEAGRNRVHAMPSPVSLPAKPGAQPG